MSMLLLGGPIGQRVYGLKKAKKTQRLNIIAALNQSRIIAPFVFEGYCSREVFNTYAEQILIKELKPGQKVIMYNASFHKSPYLKSIIENAGCNLLYLPSYSPDFNPIEHRWPGIKDSFRKIMSKFKWDLFDCA